MSTHVSCMLCQCADRHKLHHCSHNCLNASGYKLSGRKTMVCAGCILIRVVSSCNVT